MNVYKLTSKDAVATNSSGGKLMKWLVGNTYIKTSTYDTTQLKPNFLFESYAEVIAYRIGRHLGFNILPYKLCEVIIDNKYSTIACESKSFLSTGETYKSNAKLMREGKIPVMWYDDASNFSITLEIFKNIPGYSTMMAQFIILDSLILNDDRHFGNFGIIQGSNIRPALIFDNGNSLFYHKHTNGIRYESSLIEYLTCKPFHQNFDEQLNLLGNIKINLSSLVSYINPVINNLVNNFNLPKDRGDFAKELIKDRVKTVKSIIGE